MFNNSCPSCGYCGHCGRGGYYNRPYQYYPLYQPYYGYTYGDPSYGYTNGGTSNIGGPFRGAVPQADGAESNMTTFKEQIAKLMKSQPNQTGK